MVAGRSVSQGPFPKTKAELAPAVAELPRGTLLLPYQQKANLLCSTSPLTVIEKSRRIGLTWGLAAKAVLTAAARRDAGGMDTMYLSYDKEMTREFIDVCGMWAKAFAVAASDVQEEVFLDEGKPLQVFRIDFASGYSIVALPSVARALRGRQGLVIVDEAAFITNLAEVLKAALALLMWGGRVVVVSTHNGIDNPFNQLLEEIRSGKRKGATLKITLADTLAEGLYERICLVKGEAPTAEGKAAWEADVRGTYGEAAAEELDCIPSTGGGSWLDLALITAAERAEAGKPELYTNGPGYLGWDVARRVDLSCQYAFEMVGRILVLRERVEMRNRKFAEQQDSFARLMRQYRAVRAGVDQTGMGEAVVEEAQSRNGTDRVEGVILSAPMKLNLATILKKRFEDGTIWIESAPEIRTDLRAVKRVAGPTGAPRLGEGDVHPDRFWAMALAAAAAEEAYQPYQYLTPAAGAANRRDDFWRSPSQRGEDVPAAGGRRGY